mgnify:FL=1
MTTSHPTTGGGAHRATTTPDTPTDDQQPSAAGAGGASLWTWVLFVIGCVLLVVIAATLTRLPDWADRYGQIPVFLGFFLTMSLAGRWFWTGIDTLLTRLRHP